MDADDTTHGDIYATIHRHLIGLLKTLERLSPELRQKMKTRISIKLELGNSNTDTTPYHKKVR